MGISLQKGQKISLDKEVPGLSKITAGLGWDAGDNFDLDVSVFLLNENGKLAKDSDFIYFNNLKSDNGSVVHTGDNLTGDGDGDDESVNIDLAAVPAEVHKIVFVAAIYEAANRGQNFGQVQNAYIRLLNSQTQEEIAKFDLSEDYSTACSIIVGELYRHNGEWKFNSMGNGDTAEINGILAKYQ